MRFDNGWFKVWRSLDSHWVGNNATAYGLFLKLVGWANIKSTKILRNGELLLVPRGALVTSCVDLGARLGIERKTVQRYLELFEKDEMIVQQVSNQGRIITICNYEKYQENENSSVQRNSNETDNVRATEGTRIEEVKNIKNIKTTSTPPLFGLWNSKCGGLPKAAAWTKNRDAAFKERLKDNPDMGYWGIVIEKLAASDFCNARTGGAWKADIDFLLRPDTHVKVMEGKYDNRSDMPKITPPKDWRRG